MTIAIIGIIILGLIGRYIWSCRNHVCNCDGCGCDISKDDHFHGKGHYTYCDKCFDRYIDGEVTD